MLLNDCAMKRLALPFQHFLATICCNIPFPHAQSRVAPRHSLLQLRVLQWNCDSLATKFYELADVLERNRIDVALIQETNLGLDENVCSTLCVGTDMAAAQDTNGTVVWWSTSARAFSNLYYHVQTPT